MNKAYLMSFVFAAALPAMALESTYNNTYTNFLKGVTGDLPATGVPTAEGGTWIREGVSLTNSNGKVDFETSSSPLKLTEFTPGPDDTNTIVKVKLEVSVADVGELMTSNELADAQTAFAVCTNAYHAWNGSSWVVLGDTIAEVGDDSQPTNLTVEISYLGSTKAIRERMARFTIGDTILVARGASTPEELAGWVALQTPADNFTGFGASGSGLISKVDAEVMLGVAEYAGVKYGSISNAIEVAVADVSENKPSVEVLRETEENVDLTGDVTIADNGNISGTITVPEGKEVTIQANSDTFTTNALAGASGEYEIPVAVSVAGVVVGQELTNVVVTLPMSNKEVVGNPTKGADGKVKVTIQTARTVLAGAQPDGSRTLSVEGGREAKLRDYLNTNLKTQYEASDVSSSTLATALAGDSGNGLKHYQNYALGIEPTDSVKPVAVANDEATDGVTLAIPAIVPENSSGDYTISYEVTGTTAGGETNVVSSSAGAIKVPLATGSYSVKIKFQ